MGIKTYDLIAQAEGLYYGRRQWSGTEMHNSWSVDNENDGNRGEWTAVENTTSAFYKSLEFRSRFGTYSMRYNPYDLAIKETDIESVMMRGGVDNFELGVMFKYTNKNNYYAVTYTGGGINFGGGNFRLVRKRGTNTTVLGLVTVPTWGQQEKNKINIYSKDGVIKVWLNDDLIFDLVDPFPHLQGAFGPIVKGQQFARWEYIKALSFSMFNVMRRNDKLEVDTGYSTVSNSFLAVTSTIRDYIQAEIAQYLSGISMISYEIQKYTILSTNPSVHVVFDKQANIRHTTNDSSYVYAYVEPPSAPPLPVTSLTGYGISETEIKLVWSHSGVDVDGFYIMDSAGQLIATVGYDAREYIQSGLNEGTTYERFVVAFNVAGSSAPSNLVYVTTMYYMPKEPHSLSGVGVNHEQIKWSWIDDSTNETGFELVAIDSDGNEIIIATIPGDTMSFTESGLSELTGYYRYVRSTNPRGKSPLSNEAYAETLEKLPDPPKYEPYNFLGVGISHDTILWSWLDKNLDAEGFVFYDRQGTELYRVAYSNLYYEQGLLSDMEFGRSIAAYNRGGVGPKTQVVYAKTQPYGYDTGLAPVAPINLRVVNIETDNATLIWEYEPHELVPHHGFQIFDREDNVLGTVTKDTLTFKMDFLNPDTLYSVYVKAYNDEGLSMATNIVQFITAMIEEEADFTDELLEGFVDILDGVTYDYETESTPKIQAFADGIGDNLDLVVHNLNELFTPTEFVDITVQAKGLYEDEVSVYPEVPFKVVVATTILMDEGQPRTEYVEVSDFVVGGDDPRTFSHNFDMGLLYGEEADKIVNQKVIFYDEFGSEIKPSTHPHIKTVVTKESYDREIGFVREFGMTNVYLFWHKFRHNHSSQSTTPSSFWTFDNTEKAIVTAENIEAFTGTVSPDKYGDFEFKAKLKSNSLDDDAMALILAFNTDATGREHTLSAVRRRDSDAGIKQDEWAIWYNFGQSDALKLDSMSGFDSDATNWSNYPAGTHIQAKREGNVITAKTSLAGSSAILDETELSVDLTTHPSLAVFLGASQIGVGVYSQSNSALSIYDFKGRRLQTTERYHVYVSTDKESKAIELKEWFGRKEVFRNHKIVGDESIDISLKIQNPAFQYEWLQVKDKYRFIDTSYTFSVTSNNPNVYLKYKQESINIHSDEMYIPIEMSAYTLNVEQTPWNPQIHNGYYYMRHREYFLYSERDVYAELNSDIEVLEYTFPYEIVLDIETTHDGGTVYREVSTAMEFLEGQPDDNIVIDMLADTITTTYDVTSAVYISKTYRFTGPINDWSTVAVDGDDLFLPDGTPLYKIEVAPVDAFDNPIAWYPLATAIPMDEAKFRLELMPNKITHYIPEALASTPFEVENSYLTNIEHGGVGSYIEVKDPMLNSSGTFVSMPKTFSKKVDYFDELKLTMDIPAGTSVNVYTVSADKNTHQFNLPTSTNPWIPAALLTQSGNVYTYKINSVPERHISIVIELVTDGGLTPKIHSYIVSAVISEDEGVVPKVKRIDFGGTADSGKSRFNYTVPMVGKVISDGNWYDITDLTVEEECRRYMSSAGYVLTSNSVIQEYLYQVDPSIPVILEGDYLGKTKLKAQTTATIGDAAYRQKPITINNDGQAIIRPIPQNGKPIVVRNAQGILLRQVHNLDDNFKPTLTFTEYTKTTNTAYLFMENLSHQIDLYTMDVMIYYKERWVRISGAVVRENRIIMPRVYPAGLDVIITYKLKNSYIVDYNYDTEKDYALITVHMDYNRTVEETKVLNVIYETNKVHPYYIADEINLNPILNKIAKGFIYLTDDIYPAERLDLRVRSKATSTNKEELIVHAYLVDVYGNPVVNQPVEIKSDRGTLTMKTFETDENGLVVAKISVAGVHHDEVTISASALIATGVLLEASSTVKVHREVFKTNIKLETIENYIEVDVPLMIKIHTLGENFEQIPNVSVSILSSAGVIPPSVVTDHQGQATVPLKLESTNPATAGVKFVTVEVESSTSKEAMILGVKEV